MTSRHRRILIAATAAVVLIGAACAWAVLQLPALGAGGLLYPSRRPVTQPPPQHCIDASVTSGDGLTLRGWRCAAQDDPRGTIVYLHGIADNRTSARGVIERFVRRGYGVVAFDSRGHGASDGDICTYGFHERHDVRRILDTLPPSPIVLVGTSLGAAIALQAAAIDDRVTGVVAAEVFSDLETVARERAPRVFSDASIREAFRIAGERGRFDVTAVSPVASAASIHAPVLLVHGADDIDTPPDHSRRVLVRLGGPKRLIIVPGAGHNGALRADTWTTVEQWIDTIVNARTIPRS
jgi:pimeloyl-ACP methyl ester carboxylesterase